MPWRKLTTALRERLAPALRDRVSLHQARYRYTLEEVGRVWLAVDGREVIQFDTSSYIRRRAELGEQLHAANAVASLAEADSSPDYRDVDVVAKDILRRAGEYDDYCALADLEAYLSLSIEEALESPSPLLRGLAVLDRRVGKRRLRAMAPLEREHPLVRELFALRCDVEGIARVGAPGETAPR